jgi:hypothetical protein
LSEASVVISGIGSTFTSVKVESTKVESFNRKHKAKPLEHSGWHLRSRGTSSAEKAIADLDFWADRR